MAAVRVDAEGTLGLTARGVAIAISILTLMVTVATMTSVLLTREQSYASKHDIRALVQTDSVFGAQIGKVFERQADFDRRLGDVSGIIRDNAARLELVMNRQNLVVCKLFGTDSSVCRDAISVRVPFQR